MTTALIADMRLSTRDLLERGLGKLGLELVGGASEKLIEYLALLEKWNSVYNLTAIRTAALAVSTHLLDSLSVAPFVDGERLLDVGSGAGLPGIPLAIGRPELSLTLLDSNQKKCAFLRQVVGELNLGNVHVVCARVERWRSDRAFECIISRAFSDLADFVTQTEHLLAPGGAFAAMKGIYPVEEIERLPSGFGVRVIRELDVPYLEAKRHLVLVERR